jgi:hypothetical protein
VLFDLPALGESIDMTRSRVADVDHGKAGTSRAAYLGALWVLGLLDPFTTVLELNQEARGWEQALWLH